MGLRAPASSVGRSEAGQLVWGPLLPALRPLDQAGSGAWPAQPAGADAPVRRSLGAPCRPVRELQAGLLLRSLRACVPVDLLVTVLSAVPTQARPVFMIRSKSHRSSRTQAPLRRASCASPIPDPFRRPGGGVPSGQQCTHCVCAGALAHRRSLSPAALPASASSVPAGDTVPASLCALATFSLSQWLPSVRECPGVKQLLARAGGARQERWALRPWSGQCCPRVHPDGVTAESSGQSHSCPWASGPAPSSAVHSLHKTGDTPWSP